MKLLTTNSAKTVKGEIKNYLTGILFLAPANAAGEHYNTCAHASPGCKAACLFTAGRAFGLPMINQARIRKTKELFENRASFIAQLEKDITSLVRRANREGKTPCVRLNGTSDLPWLAQTMAKKFPEVQFYDYTKHPRPWTRTLPNYHLTFSNSEINDADTVDALRHGTNVAVIFPVKRNKPLPETWKGYPVVDGDLTDLRFADPQNVVVGLRAKGQAKKDSTGFVQIKIGELPHVSLS